MQESKEQRSNKWMVWIANALKGPELLSEEEIYKIFAQQEYHIQDRASEPIAFSAASNSDTMYWWHQAMQQPGKGEFLNVVVSEVKSHVDDKHLC
jgi:hypothetical protein